MRGFVDDTIGGVGKLVFAQRLADIDTLGGEEGVGHPAADDQVLHLADQIGQHVELGRDLGPADDRGHRRFGITQRGVERLQFGFHRAARIGREVMRQALGGRMRAVRRAERIVDVEVAMRGHAPREFGIVGFLARPEADIVEQADIAIAEDADRLFDDGPHHLGDEHDLLVQHLLDIALHEAGAHGREALALGTPVMREQQDLGTLFGEFEDGRLDRLDARNVGGRTILHRQVEIDAYQRDLAGDVTEIVQGLEAAHWSGRPLAELGVRGTSPSRRRCRSCGSRSPIHCRTS